MSDYIDIVFDGPPSHQSGRFLEVEDSKGKSIDFGEWVCRPNGYWALRIPVEDNLPCSKCGKAWSSKHCVRCSFRETLGKAMDKAEQKMQTENVKPRPNCGPKNTVGVVPPKETKFYFQHVTPPVEVPSDAAWNDVRRMKRGVMITEYSMKLKDAAKALVDKLKLVENDPRYATIWSIAASHGFIYTGPNYSQELKDLENILNESLCS